MTYSGKLPPHKRDSLYVCSLTVIFLFTVGWAMVSNYMKYQAFYIVEPDGTLYLSIADNFIKNGHFIQTARPYEVNFIVPPGLPLILTVLKGLTYNIYCIIAFQYVLFGATAVLLTVSGNHMSPLPWTPA